MARAMRQQMDPIPQQEPVGIVIADGGRGDQRTRVSAFVWGPIPDEPSSRAANIGAEEAMAVC